MRILHLIQKEQNRGAETFACQLSHHQRNCGHEILMVSVFQGESKLDWNDEIINLNASPNSRFLDIKAWKKLNDLIITFKPDILQANAGDTLKYAVFSKILYRWKTPIVFRNASEVGKYLKSSIQKRFNSFLYNKVVQIISVSSISKKDIISHFPFLKNKTLVIPIGIEQKDVDEISLEPKAKKHIIHVGGFTFEKNHKGLLSIFNELYKMDPTIHLHLLGDGPLRENIEEEVYKLDLKDKVTFYGFVNNPLTYIKSGDVLVLPSIIEGLPGVILEAMYCKTPVIANNVGGISEIIGDETGFLIEKQNSVAFAESIKQVLKIKPKLKIEKAYQLVSKNYLNELITKDFLAAYENILRDDEG